MQEGRKGDTVAGFSRVINVWYGKIYSFMYPNEVSLCGLYLASSMACAEDLKGFLGAEVLHSKIYDFGRNEDYAQVETRQRKRLTVEKYLPPAGADNPSRSHGKPCSRTRGDPN